LKAEGIVLDVAHQVGGAEPGKTTLKDWSPFENDGTMNNYTGWTRLASGLWVLTGDGSSTYVNVPNSPDLKTPIVTVEVWAYCLSLAANQGLVRNIGGNNTGETNSLGIMTTGAVHVDYQAGGDQNLEGGTVIVNTWNHIVVVFGNSTQDLYLNGVNVATDTQAGDLDTGNVDLRIGDARIDGAGKYLNGYQALVRVRKNTLTPAQVRARYHSTKWMFEL